MLYPMGNHIIGPHSASEVSKQLAREDVPMYIEPYRSYRCWQVLVEENPVTLKSISYSTKWPAREAFHATCMTQVYRGFSATEPIGHDTPSLHHVCGIYSVKEGVKDRLEEWCRNKKHVVYGVVLVWGKVLEFEEGYLSEYAYPLEFYDHAGGWDYEPVEVMRELARIYGCAMDIAS